MPGGVLPFPPATSIPIAPCTPKSSLGGLQLDTVPGVGRHGDGEGWDLPQGAHEHS